MHILLAAAPRAAKAGLPGPVAAAVVALVVAAIIVVSLKAIGRALTPKKSGSQASPYATATSKRGR